MLNTERFNTSEGNTKKIQQWTLVAKQSTIGILMTLYCFHVIVQDMYFIRTARYDHFSIRRTLLTLGFVILVTLFSYAMAAYPIVKFKLVTKRALWAILPFGAFIGILGGISCVQVLRDAKNIDLLHAAQHGDLRTINNLLNQGANIEARNSSGMTPLMRAAEYGQTRTVQMLFARGARLQARNEMGFTAVTAAADQGQVETLNFLLQQGADANAVDNEGLTPLMWAAAFVNHQTVETLLYYGAHVNVADKLGKTALMMAAGDREELGSRGNARSLRALLAAGADVHLKDHHGSTALTAAQKNKRSDLIAILTPGAASLPPSPGTDDADEAKSTANWP